MNTPTVSPEAVLAQHGKSFHFASKFLPTDKRSAAARLYAWCRIVDDIADEGIEPKPVLAQIAADLETGRSEHPPTADFLSLADQENLSHRAARHLVEGVTSDLNEVAFTQERELIRYCYHVAGTVGLLMTPLLGVSEQDREAAEPFALDLGLAMQLTNISRDVLEDARMDRRYLPGPWSIAQIAQGAPQAEIATAIDAALAQAEQCYQSAFKGMVYIPLRPRFAIIIAAVVYREIGRKLRREGVPWHQGRVFTTKGAKLWCVVRHGLPAFARTLFRPKSQHDNPLHRHLDGLL